MGQKRGKHGFSPEFHIKDALQVVIGAGILAIPVGFTEETWRLGEILPMANIIGFIIISITIIGFFTFYNYYRMRLKKHRSAFLQRTILTYVFAFVVVAVLLTLIQKTPWITDFALAFKRTAIVTFPASLSGTIADVIK